MNKARATPYRTVGLSLGLSGLFALMLSGCGGDSNSGTPTAPGMLSYQTPAAYTVGVPIAPLGPSLQGSATSYSIATPLPAGLALNTVNGEISGTPTAAVPTSPYVLSAQNRGGSTTFTLSLTVNDAAPSALAYPQTAPFAVAMPIPVLHPTVTGIHVRYSITPSLPAGLILDAGTGEISGTPSAATTVSVYTVTALNSGGQTTAALNLSVLPAPPTALSYPTAAALLFGIPITPLKPAVTGSVDAYSVSPTLPAGLSLNAATGQISGTPTVLAASTSYTILASNGGGSTSCVITVAVLPIAPASLSYPSPAVLAVGFAITPLAPALTGTAPTFSVLPALPAGLSIAADTGIITGTPTQALAAASYTVKAQNSAGATTFSLTITVATVTATPSKIIRPVVSGTTVAVSVTLTPVNLAFAGTLNAVVADPTNTFVAAVAVTTAASSYSLVLNTWVRQPPGHYVGTLVIALCSDAACQYPLSVPSVSVPYDIQVLSSASAWPGNHLTPLTAWSGVADWTQFQGNPAHTGYVDVSIDPNDIITRWQTLAVDVPALAVENLNTLVASDGKLFISGGTSLYARKEFDGSTLWQHDFSNGNLPLSINPPSVANGVVYVVAGDGSSTYMSAFAAADGTAVFRSQVLAQFEHYLAPAIGNDGIYTNGGTYGGLYGFDTSGQSLFFDSLPQQSVWTPAVDSGSVYAYTGDALHVVDPLTGATQTAIADPTAQFSNYEINGAPVLGAVGSVFAANYINATAGGNSLLDFDIASNAVKWHIAGAYPTTPAYHAGVLYVANDNPLQLEARNEADGSLLWSWIPPQALDTGFVSEILVTKTLLFVSTNAATYAIDAASHLTVWSFPQSGKLALSSRGVLYIEGRNTSAPFSNTPIPGQLSAFTVK